ncbi:MAG: alpha/beta hydrolase [Planctomycetota bacterium]
MRRPYHTTFTLFAVACSVLLAGCHAPPVVLAPAPYVMLGEAGRAEYRSVPDHFKTPYIPIIYWTDRYREEELKAGRIVYNSKRSPISFHGVVTVAPEDPEITWGDVMRYSTIQEAHREVRLEVTDVNQNGNFADMLTQLEIRDGNLIYPESAVEQYLVDVEAFNTGMEPWLEEGNDNAALVFVHGFNNTFDGAAIRLAKTWHAIGRRAVPILFTWPAGDDSFKPFAYNHDRESGEFAVQSLKRLLFTLAINDRIDRIHLVAHSRGTDIASTAVREIETEIAAALGNTPFAQVALGKSNDQLGESAFGKEPSDITKIETLTLVAADLDFEVFNQRFVANRSGRAARRILIYTSAKDRALGLSSIFSSSNKRLGRATAEDFDPRERELIGALPQIEVIECRVKTKDTHAYLFEHPGTLSDMVLAIRDDLPAGAEHGRPLEPVEPGFWVLTEDYLKPDPAESTD